MLTVAADVNMYARLTTGNGEQGDASQEGLVILNNRFTRIKERCRILDQTACHDVDILIFMVNSIQAAQLDIF